jgi:hypothetical protein
MTMSTQTATTLEPSGLSISPIARPVLVVLGSALVLSPLAVNDALIALALATLFGIVLLTWRSQGPPVALLICGFQWLQSSLMVFNAELQNVELWTTTESKHIELATTLSLIWTFVLATGMRLGLRNVKIARGESLPTVGTALVVYLTWSLLVPLLSLVTPLAANQIIIALGTLRWTAVFVFFLCVLTARRGFMLLAVVFVVELGLGFLSFFSSFKTVLIVFTLAVLAHNQRFSLRQALVFCTTLAFAVYLAIIWTAVKGDYRNALNQGSDDQSVRLDARSQAKELNRLVSGIDDSRFDTAVERFVDRIAYVEFFSYAADYVPRVRRHEEGRLWWSAIEHVLMPRVLFPDKPALPSDTDVSERYTGMRLTHNRVGTSISLGLPAETYIDFGTPWMLGPALVLGVMYGLVFRVLLTRRRYVPYGAGLMVSVGSAHMFLELSPAKMLGSLLTLSIISALVWTTMLPALLRMAVWLTAPPANRTKPSGLRRLG